MTSPLSTKYTLSQLLYFLCRMSYEHGQKQVPKTMDQLKRLSIPSEMLRFFNHACHPRLGHPTRSVHSTPHDIHSIRCMITAKSQCQRPWKVSAQCPPQTYTTCTCQSISNINQHSIFTSFLTQTSSRLNDVFNNNNNLISYSHNHQQYHQFMLTLSLLTTSSQINIIIIIIIITYQL